jgi:hypothetical protein
MTTANMRDQSGDGRWSLNFIAIISLFVSLSIPQAYADDSAPSPPASKPRDTSRNGGIAATASPATPLPGKVEKVEMSLEKLRDIGLDLKHVLKAASSLYDDVMIAPVRLINEPEVVGGAIMISLPIAAQPIGPPEPPNKERVDLAMSEIKTVIGMLKQNVPEFVGDGKELDLPDNVRAELEPQFTDWVQMVNTMAWRETQLEQITQGPPYNNMDIAAQAIQIQQNAKELDRIRREIYKVIRREGKRIENWEKSQ